VRAFLADLADGRGLARTSIARKASSVRALFRFLIRRGGRALAAANVAAGKKRQPLPSS
jgi:site-specific recombinase XerD